MPYLKLTTALTLNNLQKQEILKALSKICSDVLGKPEDYIMLSLQDKTPMLMGGNHKPCAFVEINSIGGINYENNKELSSKICMLLEEELSIVPGCVYMNFTDVPRSNWGWNGGVF